METTFQKQSEQPLFPNVLWNRPVASRSAGRLLVLSGHTGNMIAPQTIYAAAMAAGAGDCRVVLPDAVRKLVGDVAMATFVPSSPSGSLGRASLGAILELAEDYDAIAIGPGLSQNSETTILVESIINEVDKPIIVSDDALMLMRHNLRQMVQKPNCLIVTDMVGLIKVSGSIGVAVNIRPDGGIFNKVEIVRSYLKAGQASYVVIGTELIVGVGEQISVTPYRLEATTIDGIATGTLATFWLQNQSRAYEGLTTGAFILAESVKSEPVSAAIITKSISKQIDQF